jgi:signal transduction histidine kinase
MTSETPTVLVVDDVAANRIILERMLLKRGATVLTASNGREALEILATTGVDTILLDIMMPVMNGYELLAAMRERPNPDYVPVVVISALHEVEHVARCIELGAVDFLFKPVNWVLLEARLQACLTQKALHDREQAAYKAVMQANQAKSEFVSMVSHELKNPIAAIRGYTDMLLHEAFGPVAPQQVEYLRTIRDISITVDQMLGDLSDLSRIEMGQLHLDRAQHLLTDIVRASEQAVRTAITAKNQQFTVAIDPSIPFVYADGTRIVQILTNLLSNASKYTPTGGTITLTAYAHNATSVEIAVSDTGIGMQEDDQRRVFERYFRSRDELARQERGTGLGLTITRQLVEAHGGQIWFESAYRQGTTFYFTLPTVVGTPTT